MKTFAAVDSQDAHLCTQHQISELRAGKIPNATFLKKDLCIFPKAAFYPLCHNRSSIPLVRKNPQRVPE